MSADLTIHGAGLPNKTLAYLATPYTNYPDGIEIAFREASEIAAKLLLSGVEVYSPIAHCHPMAMHGNIDALNRDFWLRYQETMMERCDVIIVAKMKTWDQSHGIAHEIEFFRKRSKTVFHLDPSSMSMRRAGYVNGDVEISSNHNSPVNDDRQSDLSRSGDSNKLLPNLRGK